jgi:P22 coat protein - gene protein 5
MVEFNPMELTFDRARDQPYLDMMLNPRAKTLANKSENFIATSLCQSIYQATGTPGVPLDFDTISQTDAYMTELGIPEDGNRYFSTPPRIAASLANSLSDFFNMTVNRGALLDGFVGHLSGFDFFKTNFNARQIAGAGQVGAGAPTGYQLAGVVTNGPISSGNTIVASGFAPNTIVFNVGDRITIAPSAGVFMVNPLNYISSLQSYEPLSQTAQFVVTATVTSNGSGVATIPVNPTIVVSGARQNISAAIPNGAQLYMAQSHNVSVAFHNQSIVFAAPPIKELKGGVEVMTTYSDLYKMALTYSLGADIRNYIQLDRLDTLNGVAINPEFAVVAMS